ncbi:hypothetical protein EFM42_12030 [Levilactobacillus brevis]|uniref:hypothetical protein n=1 Tax=Levilactobacillus brevis TaxID=1580 RepID=UPI0021A90736|nr:hypothetical protein [Levilactobacillus brevis]MCT2888102.1 hypothetical protein [Levilactobacillus brevis]
MAYLNKKDYLYTENDPQASKEDTLSLLDRVTEQNELLKNIKKEFPLNEDLNIGGTKLAINVFHEIDNKKYDYNLSWQIL